MIQMPRRTGARVAAIAACFLVPLIANDYWLLVANRALIMVIAAVGLSILSGTTGQLSVAQGAFMAVGGYTAAIAAVELNVPIVPATALAVTVAVVIGVLVGLPALRLDSLYLAVATLALHAALLFQISNMEITGGHVGLRLPVSSIGGWRLDTRADFFYLLLPTVLVCIAVTSRLLRSRTGRALMAIRDHELVAAGLGIHVTRFRLLAFALSAAFGALAGSIDAFAAPTITPDSYPLALSIQLLTIVIVGGMGHLGGAVAAAIVLSYLPEALRIATDGLSSIAPRLAEQVLALQTGAYGIVLVVVLVRQPQGLAGWWQQRRAGRHIAIPPDPHERPSVDHLGLANGPHPQRREHATPTLDT